MNEKGTIAQKLFFFCMGNFLQRKCLNEAQHVKQIKSEGLTKGGVKAMHRSYSSQEFQEDNLGCPELCSGVI